MLVKKDNDFNQWKFNYYKDYASYVVIFSVIASLFYFISDCQLFGGFATKTFIPRFAVLIPFAIFLLLRNKIKNYKILINIMYINLHCIMWCTIWAIYYLPIKQHASEGFIIMQLMFLALAYCAPFKTSTIWHSLLIVDIIVSNFFNHYENFNLMLTLGVPCVISICMSNKMMEHTYRDQYETKHQLIDLITKDPLTGAYNREKFNQICYPNTNKLTTIGNKKTYILILDIDYFKKVNDTYGHTTGDEVLKHVVVVLKQCVRTNDYVIRWGGEEFVAVLVETDDKGAKTVAERIRKTIEKSEDFEPKVTVSIGISEYDNKDYTNGISQADKALYQAKQSGRNKIVIHNNTETRTGDNIT